MGHKKYVIKIVDDVTRFTEPARVVGGNEPIKAIKKIIHDLEEVLDTKDDLVAISAPQIGIDRAIFVIKFSNGVKKAFVNPLITGMSDNIHLSRETNASLHERQFILPRFDYVTAIYQNELGKIEENKFEGVTGEVFQQMEDIVNKGVLISDIGLEIDNKWDKLTEEERSEIINFYLESLKERQTTLDKQIEENPITKTIKDNAEFMKSVALGETDMILEREDGSLDESTSTKLAYANKLESEKERAKMLKEKIERIEAENK